MYKSLRLCSQVLRLRHDVCSISYRIHVGVVIVGVIPVAKRRKAKGMNQKKNKLKKDKKAIVQPRPGSTGTRESTRSPKQDTADLSHERPCY